MIIKRIDAFSISDDFEKSCACIGYFDGMHLGHQQLFNTCIKNAQNLKKVCITFDPDPWVIFKKEQQKHLTTLEDKIRFLDSFGFDYLYILEFTKEFASLSISSFHNLLKQINVQTLVCGFDFKYGKKNSGNVQSLSLQHDFHVIVVDSVNFSNLKISTSRIEPLIMNGKMKEANELLGYIYSISGKVVHGFKRGSQILQIPTANLEVENEYILPANGVYAGLVFVNNQFHKAMINIGNNPTFENTKKSIEAHIIDFNANIYDSIVRFFFVDYLRSEQKFDSVQALKNQLLSDIEQSQKRLKENTYLKNTRKIFFGKEVC
ncbi:bifunctional riboflavin kinase/FAD synthetase [Floccifex sp.]|uniref:bifunctional riboflavin kinase/FAD synthetase n=1 Tax=Floccifex sp. TaxID=2815810 RepID=UPI003F0C1799